MEDGAHDGAEEAVPVPADVREHPPATAQPPPHNLRERFRVALGRRRGYDRVHARVAVQDHPLGLFGGGHANPAPVCIEVPEAEIHREPPPVLFDGRTAGLLLREVRKLGDEALGITTGDEPVEVYHLSRAFSFFSFPFFVLLFTPKSIFPHTLSDTNTFKKKKRTNEKKVIKKKGLSL